MLTSSVEIDICADWQPIGLNANPVPDNAAEVITVAVCHSNESIWRLCRICHDPVNLIEPCNCKGSIATIHKECLEKWLNASGKTSCELCGFKFETESKLQYGCWDSIRIWLSQPHAGYIFRHGVFILVLINICVLDLAAMMTLRWLVYLEDHEGRHNGVVFSHRDVVGHHSIYYTMVFLVATTT